MTSPPSSRLLSPTTSKSPVPFFPISSLTTTPPSVFDKLLDRMVLTFENLMAEYHRDHEDHIKEDALCKQFFELMVSSPCSRTQNHRAETSCVAQHGTHFTLDELPRFLGCVVCALQPAPQTVVSSSPFRLSPRSMPGRIHLPLRPPLLLLQPILSAPRKCPVWHKPPGHPDRHHTPPPHPLGWFQFRCEVWVSTWPFLQRCFGAWGYHEVFVEWSLGIPAQ
jgi:hypothetical protein